MWTYMLTNNIYIYTISIRAIYFNDIVKEPTSILCLLLLFGSVRWWCRQCAGRGCGKGLIHLGTKKIIIIQSRSHSHKDIFTPTHRVYFEASPKPTVRYHHHHHHPTMFEQRWQKKNYIYNHNNNTGGRTKPKPYISHLFWRLLHSQQIHFNDVTPGQM